MPNITRRDALALSLSLIAPLSHAQSDWPNKPITLMLGFAPGISAH